MLCKTDLTLITTPCWGLVSLQFLRLWLCCLGLLFNYPCVPSHPLTRREIMLNSLFGKKKILKPRWQLRQISFFFFYAQSQGRETSYGLKLNIFADGSRSELREFKHLCPVRMRATYTTSAHVICNDKSMFSFSPYTLPFF